LLHKILVQTLLLPLYIKSVYLI